MLYIYIHRYFLQWKIDRTKKVNNGVIGGGGRRGGQRVQESKKSRQGRHEICSGNWSLSERD